MKISLITKFYKPYARGGAEIYVSNIAEKLKEKGHEVIVLTLSIKNKGYVEEINGVIIHRIYPLNVYNPYFINQPLPLKFIYHALDLFNPHSYLLVKKILSKEKPDVVHIHNYKGLSASVFKAAKDLNIPVIFTAHDVASLCVKANLLKSDYSICTNPRLPCKIYNKIHKKLINKKPDLLTAPSRFLIDKLKSHDLFNDVDAIVIPNAVKISGERIKKEYNTLEFLYVGSINAHKGIEILIKAFKENRNNNIKLHIVGKGPQEDKLKALASDDNRIQFHGFLTGKDLMKMYKMANVTVVPSIGYENSPMVIYESFMHSTPVIASRIGGIPELVKDGYNGFLFKPGSTRELSSILRRIADNPESLKELEDNAFNSVKKYDIKKHINKLEKIYKSMTR